MSLPASLASLPPVSGVRSVASSGVFRRTPVLPDPVRLAAEGAGQLGVSTAAVFLFGDKDRPARALLLDLERGQARDALDLRDELLKQGVDLTAPHLLRASPLQRALLGARELLVLPLGTPVLDVGCFIAATRPGWSEGLPALRSLAAEFALDWEEADRRAQLVQLRRAGR